MRPTGLYEDLVPSPVSADGSDLGFAQLEEPRATPVIPLGSSSPRAATDQPLLNRVERQSTPASLSLISELRMRGNPLRITSSRRADRLPRVTPLPSSEPRMIEEVPSQSAFSRSRRIRRCSLALRARSKPLPHEPPCNEHGTAHCRRC
jgi:hypothetical protein